MDRTTDGTEDRNKESNEGDGDVEFVERDVDIDGTNEDWFSSKVDESDGCVVGSKDDVTFKATTDGTVDSINEDNVEGALDIEGTLDIDGASEELFVSDDDATDGSIDDSEEDNIEGTADTDGLSDGDAEGTKLKSYTLICPALDNLKEQIISYKVLDLFITYIFFLHLPTSYYIYLLLHVSYFRSLMVSIIAVKQLKPPLHPFVFQNRLLF
jgi:hypothetical protein